MAEKSSSERKLCITASADRPRPLPGKLANFVAVEGSRVVDMELLQDTLTESHLCSGGKLYFFYISLKTILCTHLFSCSTKHSL